TIGSSGFGVVEVRGRRRVPSPPARTMAFTGAEATRALTRDVARVRAGDGHRRGADVGVLRDEGEGDHVAVVGGVVGRVAGLLLPVDAPPHEARLLVEVVADVAVLERLLAVLDLGGGGLVARLP